MSNFLVDSHCHLNLLDLDPWGGELSGVMEDAREHGVGHMLCVSIDMENFPAVRALASAHDNISASVGVHPNDQRGSEPSVDQLVECAQAPEIVAIGETGLDFFRSQGDLDWQRERFRRHIQAAKIGKKPLIVHTRESTAATLQILREEGAGDVGGVMHCFVDDWDTARQAMDLNFYISFSGIVTFKNAHTVQEVAAKIPADRLLIETDAPYLAPVPFRGKPNRPAYVRYIADYIAQLRGITTDEIAALTTGNFFSLFTAAHLKSAGSSNPAKPEST